jgi:hypothetical protein
MPQASCGGKDVLNHQTSHPSLATTHAVTGRGRRYVGPLSHQRALIATKRGGDEMEVNRRENAKAASRFGLAEGQVRPGAPLANEEKSPRKTAETA